MTPASFARATIAFDAASSVRSPNIIAPRQSGVTLRPDRPRLRVSMGTSGQGARVVREMVGDETLDEEIAVIVAGMAAQS